MKIGVVKETAPGERRVALVPDSVDRLVKSGFDMIVQAGAGEAAYFPDKAYAAAGAKLAEEARAVYAEADILLKVLSPQKTDSVNEIELVREGSVWIGQLQVHRNLEAVKQFAARRVTSFALEAIPRITRAQSMDVLSSQATVAGYKAVLLAAGAAAKLFPMLVTAAGTLAPAKVLVLGAGVAGLQAIATARRLGAVVSGFDVRAAVKEQVESLGASFLAMPMVERAEGQGGYARELSEDTNRRIQEFLHPHVREVDVVITTAQVPGKPAPRLITEAMVRDMRPGSVIADLAAEGGGNCELTQAGSTVEKNGVTILGLMNLASTMPTHASQMYAKNVATFLGNLLKDGKLHLDFDDEITKGSCITHEGQVMNAAAKELLAKGA
jgi:NAD(P) transhydrogenase subunit alpha